MSSARRKLLERFRESAIERLHRGARELGACIHRATNGSAEEGVPESLMRELHTLKGEARLLDLRAVSNAVHEIEELVLAAKAATDPRRAIAAQLPEALSRIEALVRSLNELVIAAVEVGAAEVSAPRTPPEISDAIDAADAFSAMHEPASERRWIHIDLARIDKLCDSTAELETSFRAL